jgi:hypothetical protein
MPAGVMLDDMVLPLVQDVRTREDQALVTHRVPGLDGAAYQHLGRHPAVISITGLLADDESLATLEELRKRFLSHEPMPFSADITTATDIKEVVIDNLVVREIAGRPQEYRYVLRLLEFVPPPPPLPPTQAPGVDLDAESFLEGIGDILSLPDLDLTNPLPPLGSLLENVAAASEGLAAALGPLDQLLGT